LEWLEMYCNHTSVNTILKLIVLSGIPSFSFILFLPFLGYLYAALQINPVTICLFNHTMDNDKKHKEIVIVVSLIAAASLVSVGVVAAGTTITPVFAGDNGDGVKQKAESEADCDQKNRVEDGTENVQTNEQALCIGASINANDIEILSGGGMDLTTSQDQFAGLQ
jgi:hypothetical protein